MTPATAPGALEGITVLEIGARIGASVAGSLLAQLGARVVFVQARAAGGFSQPKWGASSLRDPLAAGKHSLCADPAHPPDRLLLAQLAGRSDIILRSSDVDALAYGSEWLAECPAGAVVCDVTAFGASGPLAGQPATDAQIQALSGIMDATGQAGAPPLRIPLPLVEQLAGVYAAAGVLAALRGRPARPAPVEIALYDVAFSAMTSFLAPVLSGAASSQASRVGNRHTMAAPWNVYPAQDGWVLLCAGNDEQWERICGLLGEQQASRPRQALAHLAHLAHLARNADRVRLVDEVDALVSAWTSVHSIAQCVERLSALGIACGPVAPIDRYPREANLDHRAMVHPVQAADGRALFLPGSPFRMDRTPGRPLLHVPAPDEGRAALLAWVASGGSAAPVGRAAAEHSTAPAHQPLRGLRVVEIGHYTTAPVAARLLAALGAQVIKVEPIEGEAVRRWPPMRNGQGVFFTFQNADKRSLAIDINSHEGGAILRRLLATADVLVENLRPGALARKGLGTQALRALNPRLVYCAISGFGADSLYEGRPAFDTVIQAMSGLMDIHPARDMPLKTGPSYADVTGAAFGMTAILAALAHRERSGEGQAIDLSMQDICAWATQAAWNDALPGDGTAVTPTGDGHFVLRGGGAQVPILATPQVVQHPQTLARALWASVPGGGEPECVIASPVRLGHDPMPVPRPGPALGRDNDSILQALTSAPR